MWIEITDNAAIDKLMSDYGGFHDSCIVSISYASGSRVDEKDTMHMMGADEHTLSMTVYSQWYKPIELLFSGVRKCCITGFQDSYSCELYDATLEFRTDLLGETRDDRLIVWASYKGFDPKTHTERYPLNNGYEVTYIIANKLKYRIFEEGE
ncbi:MAG: hypothetical protein K2J80_06880 [Oscillospiraceae bacterium]|nr:hypothetical protein [Oscillospiraceae bacterium]